MSKGVYILLILVLLTGCSAPRNPATRTPTPDSTPETHENPRPSAKLQKVVRFSFATRDLGWLVLDDGTLLNTADGGGHWKPVGKTDKPFLDLSFASAETGWALSRNGLLMTNDSGQTWDKNTAANAEDVWRVRFVDSQNGWIASYRSLFATQDGGRHWIKKSEPLPGFA